MITAPIEVFAATKLSTTEPPLPPLSFFTLMLPMASVSMWLLFRSPPFTERATIFPGVLTLAENELPVVFRSEACAQVMLACATPSAVNASVLPGAVIVTLPMPSVVVIASGFGFALGPKVRLAPVAMLRSFTLVARPLIAMPPPPPMRSLAVATIEPLAPSLVIAPIETFPSPVSPFLTTTFNALALVVPVSAMESIGPLPGWPASS